MNFANLSTVTEKQRQFLTRFFGPGNELTLSRLAAGDRYSPVIQPWLEDFTRGPGQSHPILLPRVFSNGRTEWYAMAFDPRQARALREDLLSFVGPTYSDFTGARAVLDLNDPVDESVNDLVGDNAYVMLIPDHNQDQVLRLLQSMRSLWKQRPPRTTSLPMPIGRSLRNFEMGLTARDWTAAQQALEKISASGQISLANLSHLKVRLLAAQEKWTAILAMPERETLLAMRRPTAVTDGLLRAVYEVEMARFEVANDPSAAVEHFKQVVRGAFGLLFLSRGPLKSPHVLKLFMMLAVAELNSQRRDAVLAVSPVSGPDRDYLNAVSALMEVPSPARVELQAQPIREPVADFEVAGKAFDANDYDTAFRLFAASIQSGSSETAAFQKLLLCAMEIGTLEASALVIETIGKMDSPRQQDVLRPRLCRLAWDEIRRTSGVLESESRADAGVHEVAPDNKELGSEDAHRRVDSVIPELKVPGNWAEWVERLNSQSNWSGALETARRGAAEWDAGALRDDPAMTERLVLALGAHRDEQANTTLRNAMPHLIGSFQQPEASPQFKRIYWHLIELLALDSEIGSSDLQVIGDLIAALLEIGLKSSTTGAAGRNEYQDLLDLVQMAWDQVAAPRHVSWLLDVVDQLLDAGVPQHADFVPLMTRILGVFRQFHRRISEDQWDVLSLLCEECGQSEPFAETRKARFIADGSAEAADPLQGVLDGKTVAIYTLSQRTTIRVQEVISRRFPGATVRVSNDYGGTPRLKQWSRESDIFVVNTYDAVHPATTFIKQHRPPNLPILYPKAKAWSYVVSILYEYLAEQVSHR